MNRRSLPKTNAMLLGYALLLIFVFVTGDSFAMGPNLKTASAPETEITGIYTLFLYGGRYLDDIETFAILAKEGTPYSFDIFKPDFDYRVIKGVPAKKALSDAVTFVSRHPAFIHAQLGKIFDVKGDVIGFEVRPLYQSTVFGISDVLDITYVLRGDRVIVYEQLKPAIDRMRFSGGSSGEQNSSN